MAESTTTSAGCEKITGRVLDLSQTPASRLETSKTPSQSHTICGNSPSKYPIKLKTGQLVFNMKDQNGQNSIRVADQCLATSDECTGNYSITTPPEVRDGAYHYKIQPGRHGPGRVEQQEGLLVDAQVEREAGWQVKLIGPPHEVSILEGKIEGG